jgi:hypothetical protein
MLLLAVDANFRLKNRMRNNEIDDPSLGPGWGYWVEPNSYKEHLKKYVSEKDVCGTAWSRVSRAHCQTIGQHVYRLCRPPSKGHPVDDGVTGLGGRRVCMCSPRVHEA